MMSKLVLSRFLVVALLACIMACPALAQQSRASFAKAIANYSTAPLYVLITVVNDNTGSRRTLCTVAPFLLGAIQHQYHFPISQAGFQKCRQIALANPDHIYHFSQPSALKNLRVFYTPQILDQVRRHLSKYTTQELVQGMSDDSKFHSMYAMQNRDATAQVLLERGLQVGQGDLIGGLYLIQ